MLLMWLRNTHARVKQITTSSLSSKVFCEKYKTHGKGFVYFQLLYADVKKRVRSLNTSETLRF